MVERIQPAKESTAQEIKTAVENIGDVVLKSGGAITSNGKTYEPVLSTTPMKLSPIGNISPTFESENYYFYKEGPKFYRAPKESPYDFTYFTSIPDHPTVNMIEGTSAYAHYEVLGDSNEILHNGKLYFFYVDAAATTFQRQFMLGWFDVEKGTFGYYPTTLKSSTAYTTATPTGTMHLKVFFKDNFLYIIPHTSTGHSLCKVISFEIINDTAIERSTYPLEGTFAYQIFGSHISFFDDYFIVTIRAGQALIFKKFNYTSTIEVSSITAANITNSLGTFLISGNTLYTLVNSNILALNTSNMTYRYLGTLSGTRSLLFFHKGSIYSFSLQNLVIQKTDLVSGFTTTISSYNSTTYYNGTAMIPISYTVMGHDLKNLKVYMFSSNSNHTADTIAATKYVLELFVDEIVGYREVEA